MSLKQFGAVLSFAIKLEGKLSKYYEEAVPKLEGHHSQELLERSKKANKRKKKIERSRRENITEMTLEPIEDLNEENYSINFDDYSIESINTIEKTLTKFYIDAGPKINVLETRRVFKKCYEEHNNLNKLE